MIPSTIERVPLHTAEQVNRRIRDRAERSVVRHVARGPGAIEQRLRELDREWDIERALEAAAGTVSLTGLGLGATVDRRFYLLPGAVAGFLLLHAIQGWCPPLPVLRRLGFRTAEEIAAERYALKAMRGDFRDVSADNGATPTAVKQALQAARP
ncbi:hypothetical protein [Paludisphaera sp.]|uniref:hypothetical protein n=1 Tax=Paludisphaera sp. TaxID=2017432 RepID=UPI00301D25A2